jgi:alpha-acetolactate decarboxylase
LINVRIFDHKSGHLLKPNRVALKYYDFKEDDLNVHVRVFDFVVKENAKTLKNISSMHLAIC